MYSFLTGFTHPESIFRVCIIDYRNCNHDPYTSQLLQNNCKGSRLGQARDDRVSCIQNSFGPVTSNYMVI